MTFKDLNKKVSLEIIQQQFKLLDVYKDKPFWIWNIEEHKQEDIKTNGDCCFNHIIGLPQKNGNDKPLYNYEGIIYDSLVTHDGSTSSYGKYLDKKSNWLRNIRIHAAQRDSYRAKRSKDRSISITSFGRNAWFTLRVFHIARRS
jgi:hypothetical protein